MYCKVDWNFSRNFCLLLDFENWLLIHLLRNQEFKISHLEISSIPITTAKPFVSCYISWFEFWYIHWFVVHGNWQNGRFSQTNNVLTIIKLKLHRSFIALKISKLIFISKKIPIISKFLETSWAFFLWRVSDNS